MGHAKLYDAREYRLGNPLTFTRAHPDLTLVSQQLAVNEHTTDDSETTLAVIPGLDNSDLPIPMVEGEIIHVEAMINVVGTTDAGAWHIEDIVRMPFAETPHPIELGDGTKTLHSAKTNVGLDAYFGIADDCVHLYIVGLAATDLFWAGTIRWTNSKTPLTP